jgi:malonyl-CoA decarboxylase
VIRQFAKNIIESIADAGEKSLDLLRRGTTSQDQIGSCEDLMSHRGAASGIALARQVVKRYQAPDRDEKLAFFLQLSQKIRSETEAIQRAAAEFAQTPDEKILRGLAAAMASDRYHYDLKHIYSNHEAYVQRGELAVSKSIRTILGTKR